MTLIERRARADKAVQLYKSGWCVTSISQVTGLTRQMVRKHLQAHDVPLRPAGIIWTPEMDAALIDCRARGYDVARCAHVVGVSNTPILKRMEVLGLPKMRRGRIMPGAVRAFEVVA